MLPFQLHSTPHRRAQCAVRQLLSADRAAAITKIFLLLIHAAHFIEQRPLIGRETVVERVSVGGVLRCDVAVGAEEVVVGDRAGVGERAESPQPLAADVIAEE